NTLYRTRSRRPLAQYCTRHLSHQPQQPRRSRHHAPPFSFNPTATTQIYTLSLHDALPISRTSACARWTAASTATRRLPRGSRRPDRKSTRLNSSHVKISYAVFCLKKKKGTLHLHAQVLHPQCIQHPPARRLVLDASASRRS